MLGDMLLAQVAESTGALLLRFVDEEATKNWQGRFAGAIYRSSVSLDAGGEMLACRHSYFNSGNIDTHSNGYTLPEVRSFATLSAWTNLCLVLAI